MEKDPLKNIEKEKIRLLREHLHMIYAYPNYSTLGHGTNEESAKKILTEGLSTKLGTTLTETVIPLFDSTKPYTDQLDTEFSKILHWPHKNYKYIIVVMIPNPKEEQSGGTNYFNSVFDDQTHDKWGERSVILPEFIKGYINVNNLQFIENPLYDKDAEIIRKDFSSHHGPPILTNKLIIPQPNERPANHEDIW